MGKRKKRKASSKGRGSKESVKEESSKEEKPGFRPLSFLRHWLVYGGLATALLVKSPIGEQSAAISALGGLVAGLLIAIFWTVFPKHQLLGVLEPESPAKETAVPAVDKQKLWAERGRSYGLLLVSAVLAFLGFAGFGYWPLAFIAFVPALFVFDADPRPVGKRFFWRALFFGYVAIYGGFYWVVHTISVFGGFPYPLALFFASAYFLYQASEFVLIFWFWRRARERDVNPTLAFVAAYLAAEMLFPMIFDNYYGNSLHAVTQLVQIADLGGPMIVTALIAAVNGAIYELIRAAIAKKPLPKVSTASAIGFLLFALLYGEYRIDQFEAVIEGAPSMQVGIVQTNMGIFEKWDDPGEGLRRHIEQSLELLRDEEEPPLDLIVWPESAASFRFSREVGSNVRPVFQNALDYWDVQTTGFPEVPLIFGGLSQGTAGRRSLFNTAFASDREGRVTSVYDKNYLLAFGEYIPFGDFIPALYDLSPNTGHFQRGQSTPPLTIGDEQITALVCYEDILPGFVRRAVGAHDTSLLVNITNDAWFGETHEPYVHLALSTFRSIENRRYLVRSTNTGVSAIIDPLGRITVESPLFEQSSIRGEVRPMHHSTVYQALGDWPGWLGVLIMFLSIIGPLVWREAQPPKP